jgi:hypothetical protein
MATVTIHIWHDGTDGQILAIGRTPRDAKSTVAPIAGPRQGVLEAQIEEHDIPKAHESHRVDMHSKTLVRVGPENE